MWQVGGEDNGVADSEESAACKVIIAHSRKNCKQIFVQNCICISFAFLDVFVIVFIFLSNSKDSVLEGPHCPQSQKLYPDIFVSRVIIVLEVKGTLRIPSSS